MTPIDPYFMGIDRDEDGFFDHDEIDNGSRPDDPLDIPVT